MIKISEHIDYDEEDESFSITGPPFAHEDGEPVSYATSVDYKAIHAAMNERLVQDLKWGYLSAGENCHNVMEWMSILGEEFGETCREANTIHFGGMTETRKERFRTELAQVAAVALAIIESIDNDWLTNV